MCKYVRATPSALAAHHLAYMPVVRSRSAPAILSLSTLQLPAALLQYYEHVHGVPPTADVIRFLKHELAQQIWLLLLDERFMAAFRDGILVLCGDGILRRLFLRIIIYTADYPEK